MRTSIAGITLVAVLLVVSNGWSQFRAPGGTTPTPGGTGGFKGFGGPRDAGSTFDYLAKGRPYFLISETRSFREPLTAFAKENGITNEQITREQFTSFFAKMDQYKGGAAPGGGPGGGRPFGPPGSTPPAGASSPSAPAVNAPPGSAPVAGQNPLDAINQWAEGDFKRRDLNGDGKLTPDEMSESLRSQLERWDTDRDGLINTDEYRVYYSARLQMRDGAPTAAPTTPTNPLMILIEEDYDRRPDVIRVGKLPKELPKWFGELDTDQDGQVALHEWFKAGKDLEEFKTWDRNDDSFVTAEEVLFKMKGGASLASSVPSSSRPASTPTGASMSGSPWGGGGRDRSEGRPGGGPGDRPGGFGGFFKKKG